MDKYDRVKMVVFRAIDDLNQQLLPAQRLDKSLDTALIGQKAKIDSLALINLIVIIEGEIEKEFRENVTLIGDELILKDENPFNNIEALIDYIHHLLKINN